MQIGSVKLLECDWQKAAALRLQGLTIRQIADRFGVGKATIKHGLTRRKMRSAASQ
jgi:transposase